MARKIEVEIVGDASSLERSYAKAAGATRKFNREITHASRGVIAGSGALNHLGRSLAFASGGFVAFAGLTAFLTDSVKAARDAQKAQASLAAQMKAAGESFKDNRARVEAAALSYGKFGFENDEVTKSITVLERGTGKINRALGLQTTAANLARAKNIDLASAANVLAKVFGGQETALRRAVPGLDQNAHGLDLIREASKKLAGQAAANTTQADKFNAILHNTKEIIGTALLPILDKYLTSFGDWLDKMNRSGQLQRDVNSAVKTATDVFQGVLGVVKPLVQAFKDLGGAVGGTKNEVKLLAGAFVAFKTARIVSSIGLIGSAAATSAGQVRGLRGSLLRLGAIGVVTVGIEVIMNRKAIDQFVSGLVGGPENLNQQQALDQYSKLRGTFPDVAAKVASNALTTAFAPFTKALGAIARAAGKGTGGVTGFQVPHGISGAGLKNPPLTAAQQFQLSLAAQPDNLNLLRQQATRDRNAIAFAGKLRAQNRISNKKYVDEVAAYRSDLNSTLDQISSIISQAAAATGRRLRLNIPGHVSGEAYGNFRFGAVRVPGRVRGAGTLGGGFEVPMQLQLALSKAEATNDTKGVLSALKAARASARKALHSWGASLQKQKDAYDAIISINSQIADAAKSSADTYRQQRARAIRLAHAQGADYQFAAARGAVTINGGIHVHGVQNLAQLEDQLVKRSRSRAHTRRGTR